MEKYNDLVKYAYQLVSTTEKMYEEGNDMAYFALIVGIGNTRVSNTPDQKHNYQAVIDAIHLYQKDYPNKPVKKGYNEAILTYISIIKNEVAVQNILNCINYELKKEKEGTNSFTLDCKMLLHQLSIAINKKHNDLQNSYSDIDSWLQTQDRYLNENYGHKIL